MDNIDTTEGMLARITGGEIATWSEGKKKDFVLTFEQRVRVARFIMERTAYAIAKKALGRRYISPLHWDALDVQEYSYYGDALLDPQPAGCGRSDTRKVGGRSVDELLELAEERADLVLKELPPLKAATQVIDPQTSEMLDEIDALQKQGEELRLRLVVVTEPIDGKMYAQENPGTSLADFLAMVERLDDERVALIRRMKKITDRGQSLEATVAKRLYAGLPGLSDAVVAVVKEHSERSKALDATSRRVGEQVMFGDSEAALGILRHFEQDEATVSDAIKEQFASAMEKLRDAVKNTGKAPAPKPTLEA